MYQQYYEQGMLVPQEDPRLIVSKGYNPNEWKAPQNLDGYECQAEFFCTRCQQKRLSIIKSKPGKGTFACCICLTLLTACLGLLPFYVSDCQDKTHVCPACQSNVGKKQFKPC